MTGSVPGESSTRRGRLPGKAGGRGLGLEIDGGDLVAGGLVHRRRVRHPQNTAVRSHQPRASP